VRTHFGKAFPAHFLIISTSHSPACIDRISHVPPNDYMHCLFFSL
jgi:hypothetical protein